MPPWEKYQKGGPWTKYQQAAPQTITQADDRSRDVLAQPPTGFPVLNPNPRMAGNMTALPAQNIGDAKDLPAGLAMAGGMLAPLALGPAAPAGFAGLALRMGLSGAGMAAGRQAGEIIEGGPMEPLAENAAQMGKDFALGAVSEAGGSALGWTVGTLGRIAGKAAKGAAKKVGGDIVDEVVRTEAGRQATKLWTKLKGLVPDETPVPAPRTLEVLGRMRSGGWNNPIVKEIRATGKKGGLLVGKLRAANTADDAWLAVQPTQQGAARGLPWWLSGADNPKTTIYGEAKTARELAGDEYMRAHWVKELNNVWDQFAAANGIKTRPANIVDELVEGSEFGKFFARKTGINPWDGTAAAAHVTKGSVPQQFKTPARAEADPFYFVTEDGQGLLAFRDKATGVWTDGTGMSKSKSLTEEGIAAVLGRQAKGTNIVTTVAARPLPDGTFAQYLQGFTVQRQPTLRFGDLNDLMSNSTSLGEGFNTMGPSGKAAFEELREAIRADVRAHGPEVAKAVEGALRWGRIQRGGLKAGPGMVKGGAKLGILGTGEAMRDE